MFFNHILYHTWYHMLENALPGLRFHSYTFQFNLHTATRINFWNINIICHPYLKSLSVSQLLPKHIQILIPPLLPSSSPQLHPATLCSWKIIWACNATPLPRERFLHSSPANSCSYLVQEHLLPREALLAALQLSYQHSHNPYHDLPQLSAQCSDA